MHFFRHFAAPFSDVRNHWTLLVLLVAFWMGCGPGELRIETLPEGKVLHGYRVESVSGVRDGDKLEAQVLLVAGSDSLDMQLRFRIGVPTRLEWGRYRWSQVGGIQEGTVSEKSVTFLGGQSDRPNLGGVFELRSPDGVPQYRVRLPTVEVGRP